MRKHKDVRLVTTSAQVDKLLCKPNFNHHIIYDEGFAAIQLRKMTVLLDKPRYIGMCILDLSKLVMYRYHYEYIMERYPGAKLLFTDTDSFCYWIPTKSDLYSDMKQDGHHFDFSNYPVDSELFDDDVNHLVPGKMKDEMAGEIIVEFIGLRAKMYSILTLDGYNKKTAKGVISEVKNRQISHNDFKICLFEQKVMSHKGTTITTNEHLIFTVDVRKTSLSPFNDKKHITRVSDKEDNETFVCHSFGHLNTL